MMQVELQRWSGWFSSSGMDLPNCAKVFPESMAKILGRKGTSRRAEKGETLQWTSTEGKTRKPVPEKCYGRTKVKWNNSKKWSDIKE